MRLEIQRDKWKIFQHLPRPDRKPIAEVAAVQTFKLAGWATVTAGLYMLQARSDSLVLKVVPYVLCLFVLWDIAAKLGWEPEVERTDNSLHVVVTKLYFLKLAAIAVVSQTLAWAVVFWLAPLIYKHGLASL